MFLATRERVTLLTLQEVDCTFHAKLSLSLIRLFIDFVEGSVYTLSMMMTQTIQTLPRNFRALINIALEQYIDNELDSPGSSEDARIRRVDHELYEAIVQVLADRAQVIPC